MNKSCVDPRPEYFSRYMDLVAEADHAEALDASLNKLNLLDLQLLTELKDKRYAPGKWTVKDILQHVIDTERVFSYRALRFARNDSTALPGFDENSFAKNANANSRTIKDLVAELGIVRMGTINLFLHCNDPALLRCGKCWNDEVSVLACAFIIAGHQTHHFNVMEKLYYPLAQIY